eukprot:TRINITY_DN91489_c0_g1_i1.p1 TRINITY_DN91489_c0_g1~~TRINITY_DN91489_c0_g1_i1.p1  ORF type:complete len:229 (+),score=23.65 TRINITY_DN91489_c0_g1_i1:58-687(+)
MPRSKLKPSSQPRTSRHADCGKESQGGASAASSGGKEVSRSRGSLVSALHPGGGGAVGSQAARTDDIAVTVESGLMAAVASREFREALKKLSGQQRTLLADALGKSRDALLSGSFSQGSTMTRQEVRQALRHVRNPSQALSAIPPEAMSSNGARAGAATVSRLTAPRPPKASSSSMSKRQASASKRSAKPLARPPMPSKRSRKCVDPEA